MSYRKRCKFPLPALLLLVTCCMPAVVQAEVEANVLSTLNLGKTPIDMTTTADGKWVYILTPGEVQIYSQTTKTLSGRIPVDKEIGRISVSARGDQLFIINEKTKTLSIINIAFVHKFDITDSPFKGPASAPMIITVFSEYQ